MQCRAEHRFSAFPGRPELKLYRSVKDIRWFAFGSADGWQSFPAEVGGWTKRQCAREIDPIDMREVPLRMGFNTGIPGAPTSSGLFFVPKPKARLRSHPAIWRRDQLRARVKTVLVVEDEADAMELLRGDR